MNRSYFKRPLSFILAMVMVLGLVPFTVGAIAGATPLSTPSHTTKVSDTPTLNDWMNLFGPTKLSTENTGRVWTDKSVLTDTSAFTGTGITLNDADGFLVALSAIASNLSIEGKQYSPTDTLLVLDVSGSLANSGLDDEMVAAANESIAKLLSDGQYNRVGVITYSDGNATTLLPLGRYTTEKGEYLNNSNNTISINSNVRIEATNQRPSNASVHVTGATYIQSGIKRAIDLFSAEKDNITVGDPALGELSRIPVLVLMSDGAPTQGTLNFTAPGNYEFGDGSNTTAALGFVTQLTLAYAKHKIEEIYGEALVYTLGLGVGKNEIATSVLDPSASTNAINAFWAQYNTTSVNEKVPVYSTTETVFTGEWWEAFDPSKYEEVTTTHGVTKIAATLDQNYSDGYFAVDGSSDELAEGLLNAFENIVKQIELQSTYYPTLVKTTENLSGYVSFVDKLGKYMDVTEFKGILLNNQLHTGKEFASHLSSNVGDFGTIENPTALGNEFINSVKDRLGISAETAISLVQLAYRHGQLSYDAATGEYSNFIGWYADKDGNFLGFWHEGITTMGSDAATIVKSYGYLGDVDESHGVKESDMMYATVRVMEDIATGDKTVAFAIPAALIPTVTYNVSLDDKSTLTNLTVTGATSPIRLVYEVALDERISEITVKDIATNPEYVANHINASGDYEFFSNMYQHDGITSHGTNNTYSYFEPSLQNDRYYYTSDSPIYTDKNGSLYTGTAKPSASGTYYRGIKVYAFEGGRYVTNTAYEPISSASLSKAIQHSGENTWYIPAGTIHTSVESFIIPKANPSSTDSLAYSYVPFVDTMVNGNYYVGAVHGNNGRLTVTPATGIKISKTVAQVNPAADAETPFVFVITNTTDTADNFTYKGYHVTATGVVTESTIAFSGGKANILLKNGERFYISGITPGDTFNVTETDSEYYVAAQRSFELTAVSKNIVEASFVNTVRGKGNLTVAKEISHSFGTGYEIPANKSFNITVTLSGLNLAGKTYEAKHSGNTTVAAVTVDSNNSFSFALRHDEQFEVYGLPEGITATVKETDIPEGFSVLYNENDAVGDGTVMISDGTTEFVEVLNTYKSAPVTVDTQIIVSGDKIFLNSDGSAVADWEGKSFSATLQKYDGKHWTDMETSTATSDNRKFTFDFSGETYTDAGVYSYRVVEILPENKDGILYDRTNHTFTVTVGDSDMDGKLEIIKVFSDHAGTDFAPVGGIWTIPTSFTNKKEVSIPAVFEIKLQKELVNTSESPLVSLAGYSFGLYSDASCTTELTIGNGIRKINTVLTDSIGKGTIDLIFDKAGNYSFYIKEMAGSISSMKYSTQVVEVIVTVTSRDGSLYAEATYDANALIKNNALVFTNVYTPTGVSLMLDVRKVLRGRELKADEFSFIINSEDETYTETVKNKANGDVPFSALKFTKVGTYVYYVSELIPADQNILGGITYDKNTHKIIVTVKDENGTLKASYIVEDIAENYVVFTNEYTAKPVDHIIEGTKVLEGRPLLNDEFGFTLTACDENGNPNGTAIEARNFTDGSFKFDKLSFTTAGTYYYLVSEKQDNNVSGIKYDTTEYIVRITVKDNLNGALKIGSVDTITKRSRVNSASIVFTNVYTPVPTDTTIGGNKQYTTSVSGTVKELDLSKNVFTFNLYRSDENGAIGEHIESVHNDAHGSFTFTKLEYNKVGTYYYTVTEQNSGQTVNGIAYDSTVYNIKVTVTDDHKGALKASVLITDNTNIPRDSITFSNEYVITDKAEAVFTGQKFLHGLTLNAGQFSFILRDSTGATIETVTNDADGSFSFSPIVYTVPGTYTYTVKEANCGQTVNGIIYDSTVYTVTVKVTDNGSGALAVDVNGAESITFTNIYKAEAAKVSFGGTKLLRGRELAAGEFSFVLIDKDGATVETVQNTASGSFSFSEITYTSAGTYVYTVAETVGFAGGIKYDDTRYFVTVTVTDDGKGKLTATVTGAQAIIFTNTYTASETEVRLNGNKLLVGRNLKDDEFSFVLKDENGTEIETVKNNADGTFSFAKLTYTKAGTYTYTVSEVNNNLPGITYDKTEYKIAVTVTDNGAGKLVATVTGADAIRFRNIYNASAAEIHLSGHKTLVGRALNAGEFSFVLIDASGNTIETVQNKADGSFEFSALKFTAVGTHTYTVSEVQGTIGGVTYATNSYTVTVTVIDNPSLGQLVANVSDNANSLIFTNTYKAKGTTTVIVGKKNLIGRDLSAGEFNFVLKDSAGNVIEAVTHAADGSFEFSPIEYTSAGIYTYTVSEVAGALGGITYDPTVHTVTVTVTDNGQGQLIAAVQNPLRVVFTNTYKTAPGTAKFNGTKIFEGATLKEGEFSFTLTDTTSGSILIETVKNTANGSFSFSEITYTKAGIYTYEISEVKGDRSNVDYDSTVYVITVTVTDNGDGTLKVEVSNNANSIIFKNKYNVTAASLSIAGIKNLDGRAINANEFSFVLKDSSGKEIERVRNAADGKWSFTELKFGEIGKFTFTVSEVAGTLGGVTYDETVYTVNVTVTDDGFGTLSATAALTKTEGNKISDATLGDIIFNNKYETTDTSATIKGTKTLEGREIDPNDFIFILTDENGNIVETVTNDAYGNFEFSPIDYSIPGVYTYFVTEHNSGDTSIIYDDTVYTVEVVVEDDGQGTLTATVVSSESIHFVNYYSARPVEVKFEAIKILEGRDLTAGEFSFILSDQYGEVIDTVKNKADGSIEFVWLVFPQVGEYVYSIREIIGNDDEIIYDETVYEIKVVVTDDMRGDLIAEVIGGDNLTFTNVYEVPEVTTTPEETTEVPEVTTAPEETTEVPEVTTSPEETTEIPEVTTAPEETTEIPEVTTYPEETTEVPEVTTSPEETTEVPEVTTASEETTEVPEVTTDPSETTEPESPETGDNSKITVWLGAIFAAFCATAGALFSKKRDVADE